MEDSRRVPENGRETEEVCTIEVDPRLGRRPAGTGNRQPRLVLYWMDKARRDLLLQAPRHYAEHRGMFALRSPVRPNPIAAAVARLQRIEGNKLFVVGLDCMDGMPLLALSRISPRPISRPTRRSAGGRADADAVVASRRIAERSIYCGALVARGGFSTGNRRNVY